MCLCGESPTEPLTESEVARMFSSTGSQVTKNRTKENQVKVWLETGDIPLFQLRRIEVMWRARVAFRKFED